MSRAQQQQQIDTLQVLAVIQSLTMELDHVYARQQTELMITYEKFCERIGRAKRVLQQAQAAGITTVAPSGAHQDAAQLLRQHRQRNTNTAPNTPSNGGAFVPSTPPRGPIAPPNGFMLPTDLAGTDSDWAMLNNNNNNNNNHHHGTQGNTPRQTQRREVTPIGSPQSNEKMPIEELFSRFTMASNSPPINFDALYEQLAGKDDSPQQHGTSSLLFDGEDHSGSSGFPSTSSRNAAHPSNSHLSVPPAMPSHLSSNNKAPATGGAASAAGRSIPMDSLVSLQGQQQTTGVQVAPTTPEEAMSSRPRVIPIPNGQPDDPKWHEIDPHARCQVLVEFKRKRVLQFESRGYVGPGEYVVVGGDRGEDIGLVIYTWCETLTNKVRGIGLTGSSLTRSIGVGTGTVLRVAHDQEVVALYGAQTELERRAVDVCMQRVLEHGLPMVIVDAEYQFDKKKLTFFYEAQQRMDFRELVRDLFKTFRARIWMELVEN